MCASQALYLTTNPTSQIGSLSTLPQSDLTLVVAAGNKARKFNSTEAVKWVKRLKDKDPKITNIGILVLFEGPTIVRQIDTTKSKNFDNTNVNGKPFVLTLTFGKYQIYKEGSSLEGMKKIYEAVQQICSQKSRAPSIDGGDGSGSLSGSIRNN